MSKEESQSSSTSTSSTATTNQDLRVGAEGGGVALGQSAQLDYSYSNINNFPQQVVDITNKLLDFASGALKGGADLISQAIAAGEKTTTSVVASADKAVAAANETAVAGVNPTQAATSSILNKLVPIGLIGAVVLIAIKFFNKQKH